VVSDTEARVTVSVAADAAVGARDVVFTQPGAGGGVAGTGAGLLAVRNPVPTVASASPPVVKQDDTGAVVTVTGTGFRTGGTLTVSGTGITLGATTVVDATTATAAFTVASGATTGTRDVTYTQPLAGGADAATGTGVVTVNFPDPVVASVSPTSVRQLDAGTTLTVTGTGFRAGGTASIPGTGLTLGSTTVVSATSATLTVSVDVGAAVGPRDVTFTQAAGGGGAAGTKTAALAVKYPVPTLTVIAPTSVVQGNTGVTLTLTGGNFRAGASVSAGSGIVVTSPTRLSDTSFQATLAVDALAALGLRGVTYTQPADGGADAVTLAGSLQVNAPTPTIGGVSPLVLKQGDTAVTFTVTGTGLRAGGAITVSGTGLTLGATTVSSDTSASVPVTVDAAATVGTRNVTFTQPALGGGGSVTSAGAVTVNHPDPTIATVTPAEIEQGGGAVLLTLAGTGFRSGGTVTTSGTLVTLSLPTFVDATTFRVTALADGAAALGFRSLTYTQPAAGGGAAVTKTSAYEVKPIGPALTSLAPSAWLPGQARFPCSIVGLNFNSGTTVSVSGSGVTVHSTTFVSATALSLEVSVSSTAAVGARDLTITPGAGGGPAKTFTGAATIVPADPMVTSFSAPTLAQGATSIAVTVLGNNFRSGDSLAASGSGATFASVTVVNSSRITATATVTGTAALGTRDATVTHGSSEGGRAGTLAAAFKVVGATPTVSAVNPSAVGRTGSGGPTREVPIAVTGTNFMTGASLTVTKTSGSGVTVVANSVAAASDTTLTATLSVTGTATTGLWDLQVSNPGGLGNSGSSGNALLDLKSETTLVVNRVLPSGGTPYGGERVTVHGAGFADGDVVDFGTQRGYGTQRIDQNTIVTTVPAPASPSTASATKVAVKVTATSSASATLADGYTYAVDTTTFFVQSIFPAQGATGVPKNLVSAVARLSAPADTASGTYGSTTGTNCFWFESSGFSVSGGLRGFGPGGRTLVFSRTGGGNLPINSAGLYVLDVPVTLYAASGTPLVPRRITSTTHDQGSFTISSSATDTTAPTLSSITPANTSTGQGPTTRVTLAFSEELDPLTVSLTNITFKQSGTTVGAHLDLASDLKTVTITPDTELTASTTYTTAVGASVKDLFGNAFSAASFTFTTGSGTDTTAPAIDAVVLEKVPADMDGSTTYVNSSGTGTAFDLYLPREGWLVEVAFSDAGGSGIDETTFSAKASVAVGGSTANAELASNFAVTSTGASWRIPSTGFATGDDATFTFTVKDKSANTSPSRVVTIDVVDRNGTATGSAANGGSSGGDHDPFDARQAWVIRADLDAYTATYSSATGPKRQGATTTVASNGLLDLDEALRLVGLNTGSMTAEAAATVNGLSRGTNAIVRRLFLERFRETLRERYGISEDGTYGADSCDVEFLLPGEQGSLASLPSYSAANSSGTGNAFSEMSLGGTPGAEASAFSSSGTLGQAWIDGRNLRQEANLNFGVGGSTTGIYLLSMFKLQVNDGSDSFTSLFETKVSTRLVSVHGGTPVGEDASDDDVLAGTFDRTASGNATHNARYDAIMDALEVTALYASAVTAHEVGHSTGLVMDGAPKTGLFGNADYRNTFTEATVGSPNTSFHLNFIGNDIMAASTSLESAVSTGTDFKRFSPLDLAYLLGRLVFDEGK